MARKEFLETNKSLFSCGHHQQSTMMSGCNNRQQQATRKPPLPCKGPSTAPSRIPSLKKISELKRTSTKALNLPVLNLDKVRRNFLEQAELASYGGSRGTCADPPKVNSARYSTEKNRRSFLSGSLTERGAHELLAERRVATSGTLTDRSCRQSYERKSVTSGSATDRSCRDSFGSSYGLSLSNYLRNSRDGSLRNSKESPLSAPTMPKIKLEDRLNGSRLQSESRKSRGDKSAKYHSSISLSTYLPSTNPSLHTSLCTRSRHNGSLGTSKHSNLVSRTLLCSREGSDCKSNGDSRALQTGFALDSTGSSTSKADLGSWDAKRLPIQLVNTLEEALQGVSRTEFSISEAKKAPGIHSESSQDLNVARTTGKLSNVKPYVQMDKVKAQARDMRRSQEDLCLDELATSRRACQKVIEGETATCNKEMVSKLQSKSYKVSPLKLSLGSTQVTVPLGFGGNPAETVQTSRPFQALEDEASSRLALSERGVFRKGSLALSSPRRERTHLSSVSSRAASMTPEMALKQYGSLLTEYEHNEIKVYPEIYCVGAECQKLQPSSTPGACNHGFDDERGDYIINERDHISYRFEVLGLLGKGSFGQVVKCQDHKYKVLRAIKLVRNKKRFHQQALIEVKILQHLRDKASHMIQ